MRLLPLLLLLGGCAAVEPDGPTRDQRALAEDLATRTAGEPESCAPARQGQALRIVDERTLVLDEGRTIWVNNLRDRCPGLRPMDQLIVEVHGDRYCRGDTVRGRQPGTTIPGPICVLGDFTPYRRQ